MGCGVAQNIGGVVPKSLVKPCTPSKRNKESGVFKMAAAAQAPLAKAFPSLVRLLFSKIMKPATSF